MEFRRCSWCNSVIASQGWQRITPKLHRMATITRIKNKKGIKWRAQVHVKGARDSARFDTKPEAADWAYQREIELRKGVDLIDGKTVGDAFRRYATELPRDRKGLRWDLVRLEKLQRDPLADVAAVNLSIENGEEFIARGLSRGLSNNSIIREMNLIKPVIRKMVRWKWLSAYPWDGLEMPSAGKRRTKLYTQAEIDEIRKAARLHEAPPITMKIQEVGIAFIVATESGMRLNEICQIQDSWWNRAARVISLPDWATKTDAAREVPLSTIATDHLSMLTVKPRGELFSVRAQSASALFKNIIRKRAGITDATFHDSRHYAVTKLSKKMDVLMLARVIGHADIRELMTYYEADAAAIAKMLD